MILLQAACFVAMTKFRCGDSVSFVINQLCSIAHIHQKFEADFSHERGMSQMAFQNFNISTILAGWQKLPLSQLCIWFLSVLKLPKWPLYLHDFVELSGKQSTIMIDQKCPV